MVNNILKKLNFKYFNYNIKYIMYELIVNFDNYQPINMININYFNAVCQFCKYSRPNFLEHHANCAVRIPNNQGYGFVWCRFCDWIASQAIYNYYVKNNLINLTENKNLRIAN